MYVMCMKCFLNGLEFSEHLDNFNYIEFVKVIVRTVPHFRDLIWKTG